MDITELQECYGDVESLEEEEQNYYLMRLTNLWGEECLSFLHEDDEEQESED